MLFDAEKNRYRFVGIIGFAINEDNNYADFYYVLRVMVKDKNISDELKYWMLIFKMVMMHSVCNPQKVLCY